VIETFPGENKPLSDSEARSPRSPVRITRNEPDGGSPPKFGRYARVPSCRIATSIALFRNHVMLALTE